MSDERNLIPGVDDIEGKPQDSRARTVLLAAIGIVILAILVFVGVGLAVMRQNAEGDSQEGLFEVNESATVEITPSYSVGDSQQATSTSVALPADDRFEDPLVLAETTIDSKCALQSAWSNQGESMDCEAYFLVHRALMSQQRESGTLPERTEISIDYHGEAMEMECHSVPPLYDCRSETGVQIVMGNLDGSGIRNR